MTQSNHEQGGLSPSANPHENGAAESPYYLYNPANNQTDVYVAGGSDRVSTEVLSTRDADVDSQENEVDNRPNIISPTARVINRVASALERRAMNRAYDEALDEYDQRDLQGQFNNTPSGGYIKHLENLADGSMITPDGRSIDNLDADEADTFVSSQQKQQKSAVKRLAREERRADRAERIGKSKDMLKASSNIIKRVGRAALRVGSIPVVAGIGAVKGAKNEVKAAFRSGEATDQEYPEASESDEETETPQTRKEARRARKEARLRAKEERKQNRRNEKEARSEKDREQAKLYAAEARKRKRDRHEKWGGRKDNALEMGKNGVAKVGRIATRTFGSVRRFGARAYASGKAGGEAAAKTWREFGKESEQE